MPSRWLPPIPDDFGAVAKLNPGRLSRLWLLACWLTCWCAFPEWSLSIRAAEPPESTPESDRLSVAIEALKRLKGVDFEANPALKAAANKLIESAKGTPQFVELVRELNLTNQQPSLLQFAMQHPRETAGVEALRLVLRDPNPELLRAALRGSNAASLVEALGNAAENAAVPWLAPLLDDPPRDLALRKQTVHALAQTREGSERLLALARNSQLADDLQSTAAAELRKVRWPQIQSEADRRWPLANPQPRSFSIPELAKQKGDPTRGAQVFARETVGCSNCHQVNGRGVDFGPNLSEIGTKLAREAIYEAILDPSAGIAFGFEGWQLELRNGDEAFGILTGETSDELSLKAPSGIIVRYRKSEIARRVQQKTSIMPAGFAQTMSSRDLIDLVEYLSSLKKAAPVAAGQ
jgi:putative heme-binding domain-containing protein